MDMGEDEVSYGCSYGCSSKPELEDYACDGCRNDGNTHMGCGDCPNNKQRIEEYYEKYGR